MGGTGQSEDAPLRTAGVASCEVHVTAGILFYSVPSQWEEAQERYAKTGQNKDKGQPSPLS